jgi:hypothetical protein
MLSPLNFIVLRHGMKQSWQMIGQLMLTAKKVVALAQECKQQQFANDLEKKCIQNCKTDG